ncbi:9590_t:CDS:1, partial [Cetraspora pellucida]
SLPPTNRKQTVHKAGPKKPVNKKKERSTNHADSNDQSKPRKRGRTSTNMAVNHPLRFTSVKL